MGKLRAALWQLRRPFLAVAAIGLLLAVAIALVSVVELLPDDVSDRFVVAAVIVGAGLVLAVLAARLGTSVRHGTIVELDLPTLPPESEDTSPLAALKGDKPMTLRDVVVALQRAADDRRVRALVCTIGFSDGGMASVQELRDAVAAFRAAGKRTVAWADSYGDVGGGNASYYLASAFEHVAVQPGGAVGLVGLHHDFNFVRRALDKAGIEPVVEARHEYKNAMNQALETGFTPPHREAAERLQASMWEQIVAGVAADRGRTPDEIQELADRGPLLAEEARAAGLVDAVAYRDEVIEDAKREVGGGSLLWLAKYAKRSRRRARGSRIAVVTGGGAITARRGAVNPLSPSGGIAADELSATLRKAAKDKKIKAIVLRVNSPGGSAVASETIWRAVGQADADGTPVVASMSDVAASGGYYIAAGARRIVAHPGTVTGSIGVISAKPVLRRLKDRLGIDVEALQTAANAGTASVNRPFEPHEHASWAKGADATYDLFVGRVAAARDMDRDATHEVARGRVWIGVDAASRGLVDELGGFATAVRLAKAEAGIDDDAPVRLVPYPKPSPLGAVRRQKGRSSDDPKAAVAQAVAVALEPIVAALGLQGIVDLLGERGTLHAGFDERDVRIR